MKLRELVEKSGLRGEWHGDHDPDVAGIAYHSRQVCPGDLFVAIPGFQVSGAQFVDQALRNGAVAIISEESISTSAPFLKVENSREALALLSSAFFDFPSQKMFVIGITGTNGKTTVSYLLESILKEAGFLVGVIGTVGARVGAVPFPAALTTPESFDLQRILARMQGLGVSHVVMEVSSHALSLHRVTGVQFRGAIFTNLTHEHLDFHADMDAYFAAKVQLFTDLVDWKDDRSFAAINVGDPYGGELSDLVDSKRVTTFHLKGKGDLRGQILSMSDQAMDVEIEFHGGRKKITSPLIGEMNAENILASAAAGLALDLKTETISDGIEHVRNVPGRFERIEAGQPFRVIVDFAHTPDGLEKLLQTVRAVTSGRILLLFGCPGDRDKEKRPIMGRIASRLADFSIITTDDPHSESPEEIARQIAAGFGRTSDRYQVIIDRRQAIEAILSRAMAGDWVILAGRGHETFQDFHGRRVPLDDREIAREILKRISADVT